MAETTREKLLRLWWNGIDRRSPKCHYVMMGSMPDGRWFVQHTGTRRWHAFDWEADAVAVASRLAAGWIPVPVSYEAPKQTATELAVLI